MSSITRNEFTIMVTAEDWSSDSEIAESRAEDMLLEMDLEKFKYLRSNT